MNRLIQKLFSIHEALNEAEIPHAFGGAIALAYCTLEPRGTRDLDVNIFAPAREAGTILKRLPPAISMNEGDLDSAARDGQVRLWWDDTPVDVFLNNIEFHSQVAEGIRFVPLAGGLVPILDCASLAVFKAYFDRGKDWVDIEAMADRDPSVVEDAAAMVAGLSGSDDPRRGRLIRIAARSTARALDSRP